jgi:hypothetical protein
LTWIQNVEIYVRISSSVYFLFQGFGTVFNYLIILLQIRISSYLSGKEGAAAILDAGFLDTVH